MIKFLTAANLSSNVEGSIFGNNFNATGRRSSINGTTMKTENGTSLSKSCVVRLSYVPIIINITANSAGSDVLTCRRSLRVKLSP